MAAGFRDLLRLLFWFYPGDYSAEFPTTEPVSWRGSVDSSPSCVGSADAAPRMVGSSDQSIDFKGTR